MTSAVVPIGRRAATDIGPGACVGRTGIVERVAESPHATVYRGQLNPIGDVAVKVFRGATRAADERFARERDAQLELDDPHVARLVESGALDDGSPFLTSEWIHGPTLEHELGGAPLPFVDIVGHARAITQALAAVHAAGLVHRDLKPANVALPANRVVGATLLDLGHALVLGAERLTEQGAVVGSAAYMAPEQAAAGDVDARADFYALGVIVYRALTGSLPFEGTAAEVMAMHQRAVVEPPRKRVARLGGLPDAIPSVAEDLCLWLLAKDRERRVPNARVLDLTLRAVVNHGDLR